MVHQYKNNGYNIVLDVNSGAIHVVDDVTYDVIELFEDNSAKEIIEKLVDRYPQTEIEEAIQEVNELKDNEELFTEDTYKERIIDFKKRQTVVKALCLHIAHDCNLACRYCFTESRFEMRLDKYLKVSRLIKRRTVANEACDAEKVSVNGKPARASYDVKEGDIIEINIGAKPLKVRVLDVKEFTKKEDAAALYEVV